MSAEAQGLIKGCKVDGASPQLEVEAYESGANRRQQYKVQPLGKGRLG